MFFNKSKPDWLLTINYIRYQCKHNLPLDTALSNLGYIHSPEAVHDKNEVNNLKAENADLRSKLSFLTRKLEELSTI